MTPPTQAEQIADLARQVSEGFEAINRRGGGEWWRDWLKPQVLIALAIAALLFWQSIVSHQRDTDIHHSREWLDGRYVQIKLRDEQDRLLAYQLEQLNRHLDEIERRERTQ